MTPHTHFEGMLVCPGELSPAERLRLDAHLAGCAACRRLEEIVAENRARLRAAAQVRPPEELRAAVLSAAECTRPVLSGLALLLPFAIPLLPLVLAGLVIAYGPLAWLAIGSGMVVFTTATAWFGYRRERRCLEIPLVPEPGLGLAELARDIGRDAAGIAVGLTLMGALLLAASLNWAH
jgi:hypothetical protein